MNSAPEMMRSSLLESRGQAGVKEFEEPEACLLTREPLAHESRRILMVSTVARTLSAFLLPYADHFRIGGWRVDAAAKGASASSSCLEHFDHTHDIQWSRSPFNLGAIRAAIQKVREVCESGEYDLVHVHTPIAAFVTRVGIRRSRSRRPAVIYTAHGFHFHSRRAPWKNAVFQLLEKMAGKWTDYLITINREDYEAALRLRLVPAERLMLMPGIGIDLNRYRPQCVTADRIARIRLSLGIDLDKTVFLAIAEINRNKRHVDIVRAFAAMRNSAAHLVLVGEGPLSDDVRLLASKLGVISRVHFCGFQQDVRPYILASRATILASYREGLPRSSMESLACGVPVIGSDIRGIRDLLSDGGGVLFEPGDVAELACQMDWFATHPSEAAAMGERGRQAMSKYDMLRLIELHQDLYTMAAPSGSRA